MTTDVSKEVTFGSGLAVILATSLVFNFTLVVVTCRRRRLHNAHNALLVNLAIGDLLFASGWTCLSATSLIAGWEMSGYVCRLQSFLLTMTQINSAFILATIALERALRMLKPSQHRVAFGGGGKPTKTVWFILAAVLIVSATLSSIHLYGSMSVGWIKDQRSCGAQFTESLKMLDLTFCMDHAIPYWVVALPAFCGAFLKVYISRRRARPQGEIVLERNTYAPEDAYSSRLAKMQEKFRPKNVSDKPKKLGTLGKRTYTDKGYTEFEDWDSDIETEGQENRYSDGRQRLHLLPRPDYVMLMTAAIVTLVTWFFWFPWIIARFIWNKTPRDPPPDGFGVFAVLLMHAAALVRLPVMLITNPYFRSATAKTICCRRKRKVKMLNGDPSHQ